MYSFIFSTNRQIKHGFLHSSIMISSILAYLFRAKSVFTNGFTFLSKVIFYEKWNVKSYWSELEGVNSIDYIAASDVLIFSPLAKIFCQWSHPNHNCNKIRETRMQYCGDIWPCRLIITPHQLEMAVLINWIFYENIYLYGLSTNYPISVFSLVTSYAPLYAVEDCGLSVI